VTFHHGKACVPENTEDSVLVAQLDSLDEVPGSVPMGDKPDDVRIDEDAV